MLMPLCVCVRATSSRRVYIVVHCPILWYCVLDWEQVIVGAFVASIAFVTTVTRTHISASCAVLFLGLV